MPPAAPSRVSKRCLAAVLGGAVLAGVCGTVGAQPAASASASAPAPTPTPTAGGDSATASLPVYRLDPTHTFVYWEVVHMGTSTLRGRFDRSAGSVQFDAAAKRLDISITIDAASVSTAVAPLDTLLRGPQVFAAKAEPQIYFTARQARWQGDRPVEVTGELTLRGKSQGLTLTNLRWRCGLSPVFRREVCGGDFEGELDRSTFGITHSLPLVADRVKVRVQVEGIRD